MGVGDVLECSQGRASARGRHQLSPEKERAWGGRATTGGWSAAVSPGERGRHGGRLRGRNQTQDRGGGRPAGRVHPILQELQTDSQMHARNH